MGKRLRNCSRQYKHKLIRKELENTNPNISNVNILSANNNTNENGANNSVVMNIHDDNYKNMWELPPEQTESELLPTTTTNELNTVHLTGHRIPNPIIFLNIILGT